MPSEFIELFAGGGIVGLTVAAEGLAERILQFDLTLEKVLSTCCESSQLVA